MEVRSRGELLIKLKYGAVKVKGEMYVSFSRSAIAAWNRTKH